LVKKTNFIKNGYIMSVNNVSIFCDYFGRSFENDIVILQRVGEVLDLRDVMSCERVCTTFFNVFCQNQGIWTQLSLKEGIPLVAGPKRNRRDDLKTLWPITLSGARISWAIGQPVGEIPCISEVAFNRLNAPDPFEQGKLMKETWVFVVVPAYVKRIAGPEMPFDFDNGGNLVVVSEDQIQHGKELVISLSLKNFKPVFSCPLKGRENMPILCNNRVFDQCGASSDKTSVYFMRRCIVEGSRGLVYAKQEQLVEQYGFGVTPIRVRALFDAIIILESGTCSDARGKLWSFARSPDMLDRGDGARHVCVGAFFPGAGVTILESNSVSAEIGVAPGVYADVFQCQ
jgi:hypothetical protein